MKKLITLLFIAFTFWSCEKESSGFKKVFAELELKSSGSNGILDIAMLELYYQNNQMVFGVGADGTTTPGTLKSEEVSLPVGSNLTYNLYAMDWDGVFDGEQRAWSDMTFKVYVGNKVRLKKEYKKGDLNCAAYGNIIVE